MLEMTGTFSRLEERKSTETFRKSNGGKRVHSALQMEKEYRRKMVISFMDHNMFYSFEHVTLRYKMAAKSLKARLKGPVSGLQEFALCKSCSGKGMTRGTVDI